MIQGIGQVAPGAAEHADTTHQYDAPLGPHRHDRSPHGGGGRGRRQDIHDVIDSGGGGFLHPLAIVVFVAA